jgi:hypothetical protein
MLLEAPIDGRMITRNCCKSIATAAAQSARWRQAIDESLAALTPCCYPPSHHMAATDTPYLQAVA